MKDDETTLVENITDVPQRCFFRGRNVQLFPFEQRMVSRELANVLVETNIPNVRLVTYERYPDIPGQIRKWVSNVTGNPFLPDTIILSKYLPKQGRVHDLEVTNEVKIPRAVKEQVFRGETWVPDIVGETRISGGFTTIVVPPYMKMCFPACVAETLLRRDAGREEEFRGSLVACNAPTPFEPDMSWPLNEIRVYACILDDKGLSDENVGIQPERFYEGDERALEEAKVKLLRYMHFRLSDTRYKAPNKEEFTFKMEELTKKKK